ncbi:MAG: 2Fe-2S iron-sulfur cluster binding domain-containing protein [Bacteroidetes bacterium]|nr:2Fe-2S iron-sulfur cluster binding domain-containing protein [Bacteroidota bacterium]
MNFYDYRVSKVLKESKNISSYYLKPLNGDLLPSFLPGQFITVKIHLKGQDKAVTRNYTLSDKPGMDYYRITVKKEPKGLVSTFLHDEISVGSRLKVSAPSGNFYLSQGMDTPVVMISGGVGITPMMSMIEYIAEHQPQRKVYFYHSSKNKDLQPMGERLKKLSSKNGNINLYVHHTQPLENEIRGVNYDESTIIDLNHFKKNIKEIEQCSFYICGPVSFMHDMSNHLTAMGVAKNKINFERFDNPDRINIQNTSIVQTNTEEPEVYFLKSGLKTFWNIKHENLLTLAESLGIEAPSSCRMGTCASCETEIHSGETVYEPEPFVEARPGNVFICCAKPKTHITLNL